MGYERSNLEVRKVQVDFADAKIAWMPNDPELSQYWNAQSIGLPLLEGFLVQTMKKATALLPDHEVEKKRDCELFCEQEVNHYTTHRRYNNMVRDTGFYPELDKYLEKLKQDYKRFEAKGIEWCLHYVEGFETSGPITAGYFLERAQKQLKDGNVDKLTLALWQWHLSEEFEHRCVAFNAIEALYGSYWGRVKGIVIAAHHLLGFGLMVSNYMLEEDRRAGRVTGGLPSLMRKIRSYGGMALYMLPRYVMAFSPFYDPVKLKAPKGVWDILDVASETLSINDLARRTTPEGATKSVPVAA